MRAHTTVIDGGTSVITKGDGGTQFITREGFLAGWGGVWIGDGGGGCISEGFGGLKGTASA